MRKIDTRDFRRATRTTSREINRRIVLNLVRDHQPLSRADLARHMEIGRGVVTAIVQELIGEGTIYEGHIGEAARGRRPTMLFVRTQDRYVVAVDIRFSRTFIMLTDFAGSQIALDSFETMFDPEALVEELGARIRRIVAGHAIEDRCEGVGVVVPGMVERTTGRILLAPQLGWRDVDIRDGLSAAVRLPVSIENAPMACAQAQMWLGHRTTSNNFVYVTISDGVGAGIVLNGSLIRGETNSAGEFGHIPIDPDGPQCLCGSRGCWEAYTSNQATLSRYLGRELTPLWGGAVQQQPSSLTIEDLIARARRGDERAASAIEATGHYLGIGIATILNALNPSQVFVGGEITEAWDMIESAVREGILARALTRASKETPVIPEQIGGYPRLRGATALVAAPHFAAPRVA